jgi:hypothetical protein
MVAPSGLTVTVATGGGGNGFTVMSGVVTLGALSLVALIVAVPFPTAVTVMLAPLAVLIELDALTVSTAVLLELHATVRPLSVAPFTSFGIAVRDWDAPTSIGVVGAERTTLATGIGFTVTVTLDVTPPAAALIVACPALSAATLPV